MSNRKQTNVPAVREERTEMGRTRTAEYRYTGQRRGQTRNKTGEEQIGLDYSLIFIVLFLLAFGLIMLYSASSYEAAAEYGDSAYYFKRQMVFIGVGLCAMVFVMMIPMRWWHKGSTLLYGISILLLFLLIPFGTEANGATRWLYIGSISIQPAEVSKLAVIVYTAAYLYRTPRRDLRTFGGFIKALLPTVVQAALVYVISDNLSSAIIILLIGVAMLFVATEDVKRYILLGGAAVLLAALYIYYSIQTGEEGDFRSLRILAWLDPTAYADTTALQTLQGLYGIGSGGIFGKGLGQSIQKLGYIPEAQNDMIFSVICEELGLFGAISIIVLFLLLAWRMMMVAMYARDMFQSLMVTGVMAHIMIQVILNIAVVTNTIPNTGVTLPFFSYGGSAILFLLIEVGLVLNVSRTKARSRR